MNMCKKKLQRNFSNASTTYDSISKIQKKSAEFLAKKLIQNFPEFSPHSILDLGAGTGELSACLLSRFPSSHYTLNDLSSKMLEQAKKKLRRKKQFSFVKEDMEILNFEFYPLVVSNLALQWTHDFDNMIKKIHHKSQIYAISGVLKGTFKEWSDIFEENKLLSPVPNYPSVEDLEALFSSLQPKSYSFEEKSYTLEFSCILDFMRYIKKLGAYSGSNIYSYKDLKKIMNNYKNKLKITYKLFFVVIRSY